MTTWNFGEGRYEHSEVLSNTLRKYMFDSYGQKLWEIVMIAPPERKNTELWCEGYLACLYKSKESTLWSCYAEMDLQATNNHGVAEGRTIRLWFDCLTKIRRISFTLAAGDCFPDCIEKAVDETFNFVFNFRIVSLVGVQSRPISDFSSPRNIDSEVTILVGDRRLYVDKYPLICFSSVLREIISNVINNNNNEIEIKDAKVEDVVAFLRLLYRQKPPIKYENVEGLMSLIIRYNAKFLIPVVEEELISTVETTFAEKFQIVDLYSFTELQKVALQQQIIENQRKMEQQRCVLEKQRLADKMKETTVMIRLFRKKAKAYKNYGDEIFHANYEKSAHFTGNHKHRQ